MLRCRYLQALAASALTLFAQTSFAQLDCADSTPITQIQGAGHVSSLVDETVETCGVVTAAGFSGYYLQDVSGDGDDATSDAIYVSERGDKPAVGTEVKLVATVIEVIGGGAATGNLSVTTLVDAEVLDSMPDTQLPAPVVLGLGGRLPPSEIVISDSEITTPINLQDAADANITPFNPLVDAIDFYESLEGMRVSVADAVAVSAVRQFGNFSAEVFVLADDGVNASPDDARTGRGGIRLQPDRDNRGDQNPERIQVQFDPNFLSSSDFPAITVGDSLETVTGVMGYSFGNYEVIAVGDVSVTAGNLQPEVTPITGATGSLSVSSYNVLNLSAVDADNDQRALIAAQIVNNLQLPDVIALQEVQDNNGDAGDCPRDDTSACSGELDASVTLQRLIDEIVAAGGPHYEGFTVDPLVETTDDNRDNVDTFGGSSLGNIRNAFLYNPARVTLLGYQGLSRDVLQQNGISVPTAFDTSRDPLQAVFEFNGESVTIVNNHFSSRFGSSPIFGGPQPFIQAGEDNRAAQSLALNEWVAALLADDSSANVVVLGDLNTFEFTDELAEVLPAAGGDQVLFNLLDTNADDSYSFIFEGNSQALDHIFVSPALAPSAMMDYVHVNVDFPRLFSSIVGSDHEPLVAVLSVGSAQGNGFGLRGDVYSETALELFWDRGGAPFEYNIMRNGEFIGSTDAVSLFDDSLQAGTDYFYTVERYLNDVLQGSESITLRTTSAGGPGVFNVEQVSGSVYSAIALEIFWSVSEFSKPPTGFDVTRDGELVYSGDGRSFFECCLQSDTTYEYGITAFDNDGNVSSPVFISLKTRSFTDNSEVSPGPQPVASLTGLVYSSTALEIFWEPPVAGSAAVEYQVIRDGEVIAIIDGRSYFEESLEPGSRYVYTVKPVDVRGEAGTATEVELTTAAL